MNNSIKRTVKHALLSLGLDVRLYKPNPPHVLETLLKLYKVDTVFDIGANTGMSGVKFRNIGFRKKIVSFEPITFLYDQLEKKCAQDPLWSCEKIALGDAPGESVINISGGHAGSSSFLDMTDNVLKNAPDQRVVRQEKVRIESLDSVIGRHYPQGDRLFLKIDTQGYEKNILKGASGSIDRVVGIKLEMSIVENFKGESLFYDLLPYLYSLGFKLTAIDPGWSNKHTQEVYQVDACLFRTDRLPKGN